MPPPSVSAAATPFIRLCRTRRRLSSCVSILAVALLVGGCRGRQEGDSQPAPPTAAAANPLASAGTLRIDGEARAILARDQQSHEIALAGDLLRSHLNVALGLPPPEEAEGSIRLEVALRGDGVEDRVLQRLDARAPGWHDVFVEVDASGLVNPRLVLSRTAVDASIGRLMRSVISMPMLAPDGGEPRTSVLLLSLDTLRADRVGAYGDAAGQTPVLDGLARRGTLFSDAYSPSLWTLPSHVSLLYGAHLPDTPDSLRTKGRAAAALDIPAEPLPELVRRQGYTTAAFTGGGFVGPPFDFSTGFDVFYAFQQTPAQDECRPERFDGPQVFDRASAWLRVNAHRPFFLFVHTYDVHDRCPFVPAGSGDFGTWPELSDERQAALQQYYRALITQTDARVGALLDVLVASGAAERTLVVVTSDHGEALSEHGQRGHSCSLRPYEEVSRVPLILAGGGRVPAGQRVATPVSLIDVAPSILGLLDIPAPAWMPGRPLPGLGLAHPDPPAPVAVLCDRQMALRIGDAKLLAEHGRPERDELYDLAADPNEAHNRAGEDGTTLARLRAVADATWQPLHFKAQEDDPPVDATTLDPAARERLRALGYLE